jgi:hypothetical protein
MSKQTAVEWLVWQLSKVGLLPHGVPEHIHKQSKAMEREQIKEAFQCEWSAYNCSGLHYYENTYGKEAGGEG